MCLVALCYRMMEDAPVVVGANREEAYARGGEPPRILDGPQWSVGGVDPTAGGTWLGVNERGVLIAVTNRRKAVPPARPRSRGLLARDLLGFATAAGAADHAAAELGRGAYAGCNVLCVDPKDAVALHAGNELHFTKLAAGMHLLTANDVNDVTDARQEFARAWLGRRVPRNSGECVAALQELCGLTGDAPMCLRGEHGGTVSSAVIALSRRPERCIYRHAQGPPDVIPYKDYSDLLRSILAPAGTGA